MTDNFKDKFIDYAKSFQVPEEIRLKRREICDSCDRNVIKLEIHTCNECNCIIALKTRMKSEKCPLLKW